MLKISNLYWGNLKMSKQADELQNIFNNVIEGYDDCVKKIAKKYNLYVGQTEILFLLDEKTGRSQKELANELGVSKATVGVSLRRMELVGLVNRITDLRDARCIRVSMTDKGMDVCQHCKNAYKEVYGSMFGNMNEKKCQEAYDVLNKMSKGLVSVLKKI